MVNAVWVRFLPAGMASLAVAYVLVAGDLDSIPRGIAIASVVAAWIAPLVFARREVGMHGSVVVGIAAVVAAGQTRIGPIYGALAAAFLIASLLSMRAARTKRLVQSTPVPRRVLIAFPVVALPITTSLLIGLPWLASKIERRFSGMFGADNAMQATAFSTNMMLGATQGMFQSDAVVMRIEGVNADQRLRQVEYLRGAVYDDYDIRWQTSFIGGEQYITDANYAGAVDADPAAWRITLSHNAPRGNDMRWFLPANACDVTTKERRIQVDRFGVTRRAMNEELPQTMTFRVAGPTGCAAPPPTMLAPTFRDDRLAYRSNEARVLKETLTPIADAWIAKANARTKQEKLRAIERELATSYEYSLAVERHPRVDPIIDFLTIHKAGHCEYFASAMVLLARTQGISARLVGGYHTTEYNPLTKQVVVRDRNAHTWVEAWIDDDSSAKAGSWRAYDPTPAIESLGSAGRSSRWAQVSDLLSSLTERGFIALRRLGPIGIAIVLASLLASFYVGRAALRFVRAFVQQHLHRVRWRLRRGDDGSAPLPSFVSLESALKSAGHARDDFEPIEAFARRLRDSAKAPWAKDVALVLQSYADLRYGDIGDEVNVAREITRAARVVSEHAKT